MEAVTQNAVLSDISDRKHVFLTLDGLRGVAAISVVLYHFSLGLNLDFMPNAFLAVDFFFVLSGFVIAHAYEGRFNQGMTFLDFMHRRLVRLYPLYILAVSLSLVLILIDGALGIPHPPRSGAFLSYVFSLLLVPTPPGVYLASTDVFPLNIPAWSLSLEIWINVLYATNFLWLKTARLCLIAAAGAIALIMFLVHLKGADGLGADWQSYFIGWARVVWSFVSGILLYRFYKLKPRSTLPPWVALALSLCLLLIFHLGFVAVGFWLASILVLFPILVYIGAYVRPFPAKVGFLFRKGGELSYALYITHLPVGELVSTVYKVLNIGSPKAFPILNLVIWTSTALGAAYVLDRIYDVPVRRYLSDIRRHAEKLKPTV